MSSTLTLTRPMLQPLSLLLALLITAQLAQSARIPSVESIRTYRASTAHTSVGVDATSRPRKLLGAYTDAAKADWVPHLPGWGEVDGFNLFSGYVTVDDYAGRALFYIYAESVAGPANPTQDPLVLWLNGGPGCSSIGGGFMSELGPFYPLPGSGEDELPTLQRNPHAWNKFANMLFVESPAFVGFSYSNTSRDMVVGDQRTAADARLFLLGFLNRFPALRATPFYISGESYAGHYVPTLALAIVQGNKGPADERINLAGFLVGNAWTDTAIDNLGAVDYWWSHALISDQTANGIRSNCNFSRIGPLDAHPQHPESQSRDDFCDDFCNKAFYELGPINIYDIYADVCLPPAGVRGQVQAMAEALGNSHPAGVAMRAAHGAMEARLTQQRTRRALLSRVGDEHGHEGADPAYDPCVDNEVEDYLNMPEVQEALHANQTTKLPWRWTDCSRLVSYSRRDLLSSMLPVYQQLLKANLRMLVFSGDVDGIVPVVGTRRWISGLRLKEEAAWRPWRSSTDQVGGYAVDYSNGLTFATVRNAGHMVPYVQPERAQHLAYTFLTGNRL